MSTFYNYSKQVSQKNQGVKELRIIKYTMPYSKVNQANTETTQNKIPEYAKDFKREWLFIRGINKECGEFIGISDFVEEAFISFRANRIKNFIRYILKAEERGKIKEISSLVFNECDVGNIECLEEELAEFTDICVNSDSLLFDQEYYDVGFDLDYPGFTELFELVSLLNEKIKVQETIRIFDIGSD